MQILAVDPSSTTLGWAVMDGDNLVGYGLITTSKVSYDHRFSHITGELGKLLAQYRFTEVACERAFTAPGHNTAALQVAVTTIKRFCRRHRLIMALYSNNEWKVSVAGAGNADKAAVARVICLEYRRLPEDVSDHITDAIGIGQHHLAIRKLQAMAQPREQ